jgi:PTH1 family peptidyl-tRNA hydrolase
MVLIVGLGNPGEKFKKTRHNLGFRIIDEFLEKNNFPDFRLSGRFKAEISEGEVNDELIVLTKPQTFMNESGKAVKKLIGNWKSALRGVRFASREIGNLVVVHDDIDLPLGKIRIIKNRGAAGHKGVQSIINELKSKNFIRIRIGIKPQKIINNKQLTINKIEKFVLQKFNKEEEKILKEVIEKVVEAIEFFLKNGPEKTMSEFNKQ